MLFAIAGIAFGHVLVGVFIKLADHFVLDFFNGEELFVAAAFAKDKEDTIRGLVHIMLQGFRQIRLFRKIGLLFESIGNGIFDGLRIKNAIANAFKEQSNLPKETDLPEALQHDVDKATNCVLFVLSERSRNKEFLTVEEIQDEVIRQLYENTYKDVAERYASYRKQHAARRAVLDLYSIIKRDGRVVSFKPEKISTAIAKAFYAHSAEDFNIILERAKHLTNLIVAEIQTLWPDGKAINIEEIQDLVEKALMKESHHEIAKKYILYREQRTKT